jgi:hypothetical protein
MPDDLLTGTVEEIAEQAEAILIGYLGRHGVCIAQGWDNRIDCLLRQPDGTIITGEVIPLREATAIRIREAGERLQKRQAGINVVLKNELRPPIRIVPKSN